jgi:carbonic anhydrase
VLRTAAGTAALAAASQAWAQDACEVFTPARQKAVSPEAALQMLKDGNERFVSGKTINCDLMAQVRATAGGQAPFAAIVGCIDSRVPPELVFDQRLGDIFAARIAGNFVDIDIIGSLEFATKVVGARAIVVLGHTDCGAIKGAIDNVKLGNLTAVLKHIEPAVKAAEAESIEGEHTSKNKKLVQAVADINANLAAKMLVEKSDVLRDLVANKELAIASAMHDLNTGRVTFFA